jgi:biopolymer transport protein ExbD
VNINELADKVRAQYGKNGKAVYVRADKATSWDTAVQVIDVLGRAKIDVRVVTTTQEDTRRRR